MAGWRSGESDQTRRRRGNSQTWPTRACWSSGHGRHPAMRSRGDSTRREGAPWGLAKSSSWWAGVDEVGPSVNDASRFQALPAGLANLDRRLKAWCPTNCLEPTPRRQTSRHCHHAMHSRSYALLRGRQSGPDHDTGGPMQLSAGDDCERRVDAVLESCSPSQGAAAARGGAGCSWC